jgi:light-regulated signal transduction histidine kinase (bacteriophytochrome)
MVRLNDDLLLRRLAHSTLGQESSLQPDTDAGRAVSSAMPWKSHRSALDAGGLATEVSLPPEAIYVYADHARFSEHPLQPAAQRDQVHRSGDPSDHAAPSPAPIGRDTSCALSVRDNGAGIAAEALPHIFELFARGHQPAGWAGSAWGSGGAGAPPRRAPRRAPRGEQ